MTFDYLCPNVKNTNNDDVIKQNHTHPSKKCNNSTFKAVGGLYGT